MQVKTYHQGYTTAIASAVAASEYCSYSPDIQPRKFPYAGANSAGFMVFSEMLVPNIRRRMLQHHDQGMFGFVIQVPSITPALRPDHACGVTAF